MAFHVTTTVSNGYRCGCCARDWDSDTWYPTLEEALEQVPTELMDGQPHAFNGDAEVTCVEIIDGATGEKVAWARASWSTGYGRGSGYKFTCWAGYRPDSGSFEVVYSGRTKIDRPWSDVLADMAAERKAADLAAAERQLAEAQATIEKLRAD